MDGFVASIFPDLQVLDRYIEESLIVLRVASCRRGNHCPECGLWSQRVHSSYYRTVQDVPIHGTKVILRVRARKFFCDNSQCSRTIFTERFEGFLAESQQKTVRLREMLTHIAFSLGGNPGAALARRLGISVGKDTLLTRIREASVPEQQDIEDLRVVGIDDWAYRRGQRYGTIICDLEHHSLVDVLPDRRVATVADWLRAHPRIQIVSRDRAGGYADAIRQGLPTAMQVADRWHLLKNLGDAVEHYLARQRLPGRETQPIRHSEPRPTPQEKPTQREQAQSERRQAKWERVEQVKQLHQSGIGIREISRRLGLSRLTVRTYLTWTEVPQTVRRPRYSLLDPYRKRIADLLSQSLSGPAILRAIQEQGYEGSRSTLGPYLAELRRSKCHEPDTVFRRCRVSPRHATMLVTKSEGNLNEEDKSYRRRLFEEVPGAETIRSLCASFQELMQKHDRDGLNDWLDQAQMCGIREMCVFAQGIRMDLQAVAAGMAEPWSNGQVEGQVNRLKTLKRQMYGRAGFALLRARVLSRD